MAFSYSKISAAMGLSTVLLLSACSNSEAPKNNTLTASTPATGEASNLSERNAEQRLIHTLEAHFKLANIPAKILEIKPTEVPKMYWVNLEGMGAVYASADGKYIFQGDIIRLGEKSLHNVSKELQSDVNKRHFEQLKSEDLLIYKAKGKTKHVIYVFTDTSCPYCHKFHEQMDEMNRKGIEVRYIAWPRGEDFIPTMESVWCSEDRHAGFDLAIQDQPLAPATCQNPVRDQYQLGINIGVNGTPAIYNEQGQYLGGYLSTTELIKHLDN